MRGKVVLLAAVLALLGIALPAVATAQERRGLWGGAGGGFGSADASAEEVDGGDREGSAVVYFNLGWTLSQRLLVGAEFDVWSKTADLGIDSEGTLSIYNVSGTLTFYPSPASGFFVKGGAGGSFINADINVLNASLSVDLGAGFGFLVGAGYDFSVGRNLSIVPAVSVWAGQTGDLEFAGQTLFRGWTQNVVDVTIGIKFN